MNTTALHKREYRFGSLPNSGWRFLMEGERIEKGDFAYHVSDSTYIPCEASVGRKVDAHDSGKTYIRLVEADNIREEELNDLQKRYGERPILTDTLLGFSRNALELIQEEFQRRYPGTSCILYTMLHNGRFEFQISHLTNSQHDANRCHIGTGETPEAAFAHLESQLGPPMSEPERLRCKAHQLMQDAEELEARQVKADLQASHQLPVSSPA